MIQTNGFAIGVNLTGYDDTLRLWKVKGSVQTIVVNTDINWQTDIGVDVEAEIIVERTIDGNWSVSVYRLDNDLVGSGSGADNELFSADWFEIMYRYTSTRDRLLWFDDLSISGIFYEDIEAPEVTEYRISGMNSIEITLNESPSEQFISAENFSLDDPHNNVVSVSKINSLTYIIQGENNFNNKEINRLIISSMCDNSGNCIKNISVNFTPVWAEPGDVIISEIMADPVPGSLFRKKNTSN